MTDLIHTLMEMETAGRWSSRFPHAPDGWSPAIARRLAHAEGVALTDEHWEMLAALQDYFARHEERTRNMRELHDALDERFHGSGGMKYLYRLFPRGPVAQGCRIAGLQVPAISADRGFGSVM